MLLNDGLNNITNLEGTRRSDAEYIAPETPPSAKKRHTMGTSPIREAEINDYQEDIGRKDVQV